MKNINDIEKKRRKNLNALRNNHPQLCKDVNKLFGITYEICEYYDQSDEVLRSTGIVFSKGILLSKSVYSLIIDGHAQESGSILRNLVEVIELIKYIRLDESRVDELVNDKLPSPGKRAKIIEGDFHNLRKYLNEHSSHFNMSYYSVSHVIDVGSSTLLYSQNVSLERLSKNLFMLCNFIFHLCHEMIHLLVKRIELKDDLIYRLANVQQRLIERSIELGYTEDQVD